tara:strand:- start:200 stop:685 length:486 start_codon:yes stop_codon:yes gene_type:complete
LTIILGIDPGSRVTGYGVIVADKGQPKYLASGCIRMPTGEMSARLLTIHQSVTELISQYAPDQAAIEQVFVGKSASSALKLGHARGAAMLAIAAADIPLGEYAPRSIKQAVAGTGAADKIQVQDMVVKLLRLSKSPPSDAADALAVALCHTYSDNPYAQIR